MGGNADANLAGILALKQADPVEYADAIERAEEFIETNDQSLADCLMHTQLYFALIGEWSWDSIMNPQEPEMERGGHRSGCRVAAGVGGHQFFAIQLLKITRTPEVDDVLRGQADDIVEYLLAQQQSDGCWMSTAACTNDIVVALHEARALQVSADRIERMDEAIADGLSFLCDDRQLENGYVSLYEISVTETALSLRALLESGIDADDPVIRSGADWLMRSKYPCGGWGFTPATAPHNDAEDSGFCMAVLAVTDAEYATKQADFLMDEQSKDGGWAPFSRDLGPFYLTHYTYDSLELADHVPGLYFMDPSVPEISAHALTGLGKVGYGPEDEVVQRAEEYFKAVQFDDGKWFSAWWTGYVYGTAAVLSSLHDVGIDLEQAYIRQAVDWMEAHHNADGGWGDDWRAIRDPEWAGHGDSSAMHTAVAVIALLDVGEPADSPYVTSGVDYLIDTQRSDGGWDDDHQLAMYGDPYSNVVVSNAYALWALSAYRQAVEAR